MAVIVNDSKGYTQDEFKEYLKNTVTAIVPDAQTMIDSVDSAQSSATSASTSASTATNKASAASTSASNASSSASNALTYSNNAASSATAAKASQDAAKTSETNAATSASNAAASAKSASSAASTAVSSHNDSSSAHANGIAGNAATATQATNATNATNDGKGNNIVNTYATKSSIASSVTTASLTVSGATSVPTANAGNSSNAIASTEFVAKSISALVNGAPEQLNTLNELATALGNDSNFSATITAELGKKLDESEASDTYVTKTLWQSSQNDMGTMLYQFTNQLQRNKKYKVGDIAYSPLLPSWAYLECITAGTTGDKEPDFSSVSSTGGAIADMADGNVHWRVRDTRCRYEVGDIIAKTTTPKSYEYLLPCDGSSFDKTKYPMLANIFTDGKTPTLNDGRFLEGSTSAGTSKNAGLPNITGAFRKIYTYSDQIGVSGAFSMQTGNTSSGPNTQGAGPYASVIYDFDASKSNNIYGASNTVQPKSYTVVYYVCYGG